MVELQQKITIATEHYNNWLLRYRGVLPWQRFITRIHEDNKIAVDFHIECVTKATLLTWKQRFEYKSEQRNKKADQFYVTMATKRSLTAWKKVGQFLHIYSYGCHGYINIQHIKDTRRMSNHAEQWYRWLLVRRYFRGWHGYVRQQEIKMWEKERRAKVHYQWLVASQLTTVMIHINIDCTDLQEFKKKHIVVMASVYTAS